MPATETDLRDVTKVMLGYRECLRHVWNAYLADSVDIDRVSTVFGRLEELLFEALVSSQIEEWSPSDVVQIVPSKSAPIHVRREASDGNVYWDAPQAPSGEHDAIQLAFVAFYDFFEDPFQDFRFYRCLIRRFDANPQYENREAIVDVAGAKAFFGERLREPGGTGSLSRAAFDNCSS